MYFWVSWNYESFLIEYRVVCPSLNFSLLNTTNHLIHIQFLKLCFFFFFNFRTLLLFFYCALSSYEQNFIFSNFSNCSLISLPCWNGQHPKGISLLQVFKNAHMGQMKIAFSLLQMEVVLIYPVLILMLSLVMNITNASKFLDLFINKKNHVFLSIISLNFFNASSLTFALLLLLNNI